MINFSNGYRVVLFVKIVYLTLFCIGILLISCNNRRYPCPGNGQTTASSISRFDEDGNLKKRRKKIKKNDKGLVNKKQYKRLKSKRKTSLDDRPKNFKK